MSKRDKYFLYNNLSILLKTVKNERTTIDLRNEASIYGVIDETDGDMNVMMSDCVFTDPRGDSFKYDNFYVQARNIRCVHIPPSIRIIPAIKEQLQQLKDLPKEAKDAKQNYRTRRNEQRQREGLVAVEKILASKADSADIEKKENS